MPDTEPRIRRVGGYIDAPPPEPPRRRWDWLLLLAIACYVGAFAAVLFLVVTA